MSTHLEVMQLGLGNHQVKAVEVVTTPTIDFEPDFLGRIGLPDAGHGAVVRKILRHTVATRGVGGRPRTVEARTACSSSSVPGVRTSGPA
jgi:hypothetical protein